MWIALALADPMRISKGTESATVSTLNESELHDLTASVVDSRLTMTGDGLREASAASSKQQTSLSSQPSSPPRRARSTEADIAAVTTGRNFARSSNGNSSSFSQSMSSSSDDGKVVMGWFLSPAGESLDGPYSGEAMRAFLEVGKIGGDALVWSNVAPASPRGASVKDVRGPPPGIAWEEQCVPLGALFDVTSPEACFRADPKTGYGISQEEWWRSQGEQGAPRAPPGPPRNVPAPKAPPGPPPASAKRLQPRSTNSHFIAKGCCCLATVLAATAAGALACFGKLCK